MRHFLHKDPPPTKNLDSYRHEAFVLVQPLLVGGNEKSSILDPACVEPRLLLQVLADHIPGVGQELYLDVTGTELPQQAWWTRTFILADAHKFFCVHG